MHEYHLPHAYTPGLGDLGQPDDQIQTKAQGKRKAAATREASCEDAQKRARTTVAPNDLDRVASTSVTAEAASAASKNKAKRSLAHEPVGGALGLNEHVESAPCLSSGQKHSQTASEADEVQEYPIVQNEDKRWVCPLPDCGLTYATKCSAVRHIDDSHRLPKLYCGDCDTSFTRANYLARHRKSQSHKKRAAARADGITLPKHRGPGRPARYGPQKEEGEEVGDGVD